MTLEPAPPVVELRQYLLRLGRRDELIELFDREFVESQEALGIRVIGQFRDVDRVNHFIWLRGFADHGVRREALERFYGGPVWRRHGEAANATMIDAGDVHQLRPSDPRKPLAIREVHDRDAPGNRGSVVIVVGHRHPGRAAEHDRLLRRHLVPELQRAGLRTLATYATDTTENPFPALPVRSANALVWIGAGDTAGVLEDAAEHISAARAHLNEAALASGLTEFLLDVLRLEPTCRSCLNGADR
jgi:hypothetical protein